MNEYYSTEDCLTATKYAKFNGLDPEIIKAAVKRAQGLVVQDGPRKIPVIISTGRKNSTPKINPATAAQAKFLEIVKKIQEAKK